MAKQNNTDKSEETKEATTPRTSKKIKFGEKQMTISKYATSTGLGARLKPWLNRKYDSKEQRTGNEWFAEMKKEQVQTEKPEILDVLVPGSK